MRAIAIITLLFVPAAYADVDYSKCMRFFNNNPSKEGNIKGYRVKISGPFVPQRLRYIPFHLQPNGQIDLHEGAKISQERNSAGKIIRETITYHSPSLESLETLGPDQLKGNKETKIIIERNSHGYITGITENVGLVSGEDEENKEIERIKSWNGGDAELAFAYLGTQTTFKVEAGECVATESKELIAHMKNGKRQETEIIVFNTKLCHEIDEFIYKNTEARGTFDKTLNDKMVAVLLEHAREFLVPTDREKEFISDAKIFELIDKEFEQNHSKNSLQLQVFTGYVAATRLPNIRMRKYGTSAIISGYQIVANCYYQDLGDFILYEYFWPEVDEN